MRRSPRLSKAASHGEVEPLPMGLSYVPAIAKSASDPGAFDNDLQGPSSGKYGKNGKSRKDGKDGVVGDSESGTKKVIECIVGMSNTAGITMVPPPSLLHLPYSPLLYPTSYTCQAF